MTINRKRTVMIEDDMKILSGFYSPFEEEREAWEEIYGRDGVWNHRAHDHY
jgi:hypothetical protein